MPVSKAQQKAVTKYVKNKYDRFGLTMPKGNLDEIKTAAAAAGESVNAYINTAISQRMERDGGGTPSGSPQEAAETTPGAGVVSLPSDASETVQSAAEGKRREEP